MAFSTLSTLSSFGIDWLADNSWEPGSGGGIDWHWLSKQQFRELRLHPHLVVIWLRLSKDVLHHHAPRQQYLPELQSAVDGNLVSGAAAGGDVPSPSLYAADNQVSYLFNSSNFGSSLSPELTLNVTPVPEPGMLAR